VGGGGRPAPPPRGPGAPPGSALARFRRRRNDWVAGAVERVQLTADRGLVRQGRADRRQLGLGAADPLSQSARVSCSMCQSWSLNTLGVGRPATRIAFAIDRSVLASDWMP
jgi:hypothetical protein